MSKIRKLILGGKSGLNSNVIRKHIVEGFKWGANGFFLLFINLKSTNNLILKRILGHSLTYNEKRIVRTTIRDTFKIIPFSFFLFVPFAEFGLPFAIKYFPSLLPSTFTFESTRERERKILETKKSEVLEFHSKFQEIIMSLINSEDSFISSHATEFKGTLEQLIKNNKYDSNMLLKILSSPIREKFELENLGLDIIRSICNLMDIYPINNKFFLSLRIRYKFLKLKKEDKDILWEGLGKIDKKSQQKVLISRFIDPKLMDNDEYKDQFINWVKLFSLEKVPHSVILWIQIAKLMGG
ncbi:putative LETM1-like protein [Cryptosporidium felis]|nr:putative LETM1-like protein [Cryptosporidium felis]